MKALKIIAMLAVIFTVTGFGLNQWGNVIQKAKAEWYRSHPIGYVGTDGYWHRGN
jgi:hypothetical protein